MPTKKKRVEATCTQCPHKGVTTDPSKYVCDACYYSGCADDLETTAKTLRSQADEAEQGAERYREKAREYMDRHPEAGPREVDAAS